MAPGTEGGTAQEVHERQRYRFGSWKRGAAELTYRRFFDVTTLAAVRVEDPDVFHHTHRLLLEEFAADGRARSIGVSTPPGQMALMRTPRGP